MNKKIISITTNTLGTIIVIRSPIKRKWLFNLCIGPACKAPVGSLLLMACAYLFIACDAPTSVQEAIKPHYKYTYEADTIYHSEWSSGLDTLSTEYNVEWNTATVYMYQDSTKWSIGSLSHKTAYKTSSKPVYFDGVNINIVWPRLPTAWDKVVIRFSKKDSL